MDNFVTEINSDIDGAEYFDGAKYYLSIKWFKLQTTFPGNCVYKLRTRLLITKTDIKGLSTYSYLFAIHKNKGVPASNDSDLS